MTKRCLAVMVLIAGFGAGTALGAVMGPAMSQIEPYHFSVGGQLYMQETDAEASDSTLVGTFGDDSVTIKDMESMWLLADLGYGVMEGLDVYAHLGIAGAEFSGFESENANFDGGTDLAWGLGAKGTLYEQDGWIFGAMAQILWADTDDTGVNLDDEDDPWQDLDVDLSWFELRVALGATYDLMDAVRVYGGPFYFMIDGDMDVKQAGSAKRSVDLEEDSSFGGFVGAQIDVMEDAKLNVEGQFTGGGWGVGVGMGWAF